jgi:hypothetical protein
MSAGREPVRYSVHTLVRERIVEIGIGIDLDGQIAFAQRHHARTGEKTWVWNVKTGATVLMLKRDSRAAGGAA